MCVIPKFTHLISNMISMDKSGIKLDDSIWSFKVNAYILMFRRPHQQKLSKTQLTRYYYTILNCHLFMQWFVTKLIGEWSFIYLFIYKLLLTVHLDKIGSFITISTFLWLEICLIPSTVMEKMHIYEIRFLINFKIT